MSQHVARRKGFVSIGPLIWLVLVTATITAAYLFLPPFFSAWKVNRMLGSICAKSESLETVDDVKAYAVVELEKQGFHFKPTQLQVTRVERTTTIFLNYIETVRIPLTDIEVQLAFDRYATSAPH